VKTLLDCQERVDLKIVLITGGRGSRLRLSQLGLGIDSTIRLIRNAPFSGPLVISFDGTEIAIGKGIAAKIRVEELR
jgi:ferrous iron transport protein A